MSVLIKMQKKISTNKYEITSSQFSIIQILYQYFIVGIFYNSIKTGLQRMRRKKPEDQMMEEAIEKASQLINLLQKENSDLKRKTERSQKEAQALKKQIRQLKQRYEIQSKQNAKNAQLLINKTSQLKKLEEALFQSEQQLKKRTHNNKELHQKISVLTAKLKQKSKQFNEQRTMYLSLQNQNEYLLKKIGKEEDKQNQTNNKLKEIISQKQIQIKEVIKLKEAFSRRCEELKADNASLIEAAASYKQRAIENIPQPVLPNTKHILVKHNRTFSQRPPLPGSQILVKLIEQKLGVKPQLSLEKQLEQLSNFISYRFDHIQKLWQGIHSKMQEKEIMKISNLKELLVASQRISTYLNELISCQP